MWILESSKKTPAVMGSTLGKPKKPIVTLALIEGNKTVLNWIAGDKRAVSYNIIKSTKEDFFNKSEKLIPNIRGLRFEDQDIVRGIAYEYSLEAVDEKWFSIKKNICNFNYLTKS